ncbi:MAG: hypothetical protein K8T91_03880 [Planctomycetes bacterium]|nr:hypothetical protein [Planctomycetota bacterium]
MAFRTDKVSGVITCGFGIVMTGFALFGLLIITIQRFVFSMAPRQGAHSAQFLVSMKAVHSVMFLYLPLLMLGGVVLAVAGFYVVRGSRLARRIAQVTAVCGYVWLGGYVYGCYQVIFTLHPTATDVAPRAVMVFDWFSLIGGTVLGAAFPSGLLFLLSRTPELPNGEKVPHD